MSSRDSGNNNQPEASDDAWSYVIPHFKTLPADVQSLIKTTLPTLVEAAQKLSTQSGSAPSNTQAKHNLGIVAPGVSYEVTGADRWSSTGGNTQEAILGNKFHKTHLTHSQTIGEDLTQEQQEDYVASYSKIHGQSLEQITSHKFEEIGGNFNSAIGTNNLSNQNADTSNSDGSSPSPSSTYAYAQNIYGSRKVSIKENDVVQANSLTEVYGDADTTNTYVHTQTLYGGQNQMIQGDHYMSVKGSASYTYGGAKPQPTPTPTPPNDLIKLSVVQNAVGGETPAQNAASIPNSDMSQMGLGMSMANALPNLGVDSSSGADPSDVSKSVQPEASDDAWSYVIPHFKTLPADVQSLIKTTLPTLVEAAQKLSTQSGSAPSNTQAKHNLGIVAPGVSYEVTGADRWSSTGGNTQEAILGNKFHKTHLTHSQTIGEDLTQEQQEDYVASYSKIHGQSLEQITSHKFEEIGGNFNSAIGHNQSQSIFGSRNVFIKEKDSLEAKSLIEVYGNTNTTSTFVHGQTLKGGQVQIIGGNHQKSVGGVAFYTYGRDGPQPTAGSSPPPSSNYSAKLNVVQPGSSDVNVDPDGESDDDTPTPPPSEYTLPENSGDPSLISDATSNAEPFVSFTLNEGNTYTQNDEQAISWYRQALIGDYKRGTNNLNLGMTGNIYLGAYMPTTFGLKLGTTDGVYLATNALQMSQDLVKVNTIIYKIPANTISSKIGAIVMWYNWVSTAATAYAATRIAGTLADEFAAVGMSSPESSGAGSAPSTTVGGIEVTVNTDCVYSDNTEAHYSQTNGVTFNDYKGAVSNTYNLGATNVYEGETSATYQGLYAYTTLGVATITVPGLSAPFNIINMGFDFLALDYTRNEFKSAIALLEAYGFKSISAGAMPTPTPAPTNVIPEGFEEFDGELFEEGEWL